jgi:hypothetical protein
VTLVQEVSISVPFGDQSNAMPSVCTGPTGTLVTMADAARNPANIYTNFTALWQLASFVATTIIRKGLNNAMTDWRNQLNFDPLPSLLSSRNESLNYFVRRDLLDEHLASVEVIWQTPEVRRILRRQLDEGGWKYPAGKKHIRSEDNYNQIETYRILGQLVEKHGLNRKHPATGKAAEYLFSHQTEEGDLARGILGNQYAPYYCAAMMELLIKAGYDADPRIEKGFQCLLAIRQDDGGWTIPFRTVGSKSGGRTGWTKILNAHTISPDLSKPSSHMVTGMVLRAFAAHGKYKRLCPPIIFD